MSRSVDGQDVAGPPDVRTAIDLLRTLVAFDTTSHLSNLALIRWIVDHAAAFGARSRLTFDETGEKANLLLSVGPDVAGGVVLSAHSDTVPVSGQAWSHDPFDLHERDGRLHGRGSADMKGFIAACLATLPGCAASPLKVPVHLALSFDEESGCAGVPLLVNDLMQHVPRPALVWVGEPTGLRLATAHKGICLFRTRFEGKEAHSSLAHEGVSAIAAAARFIQHLLDTGLQMAWRESRAISERPRHTTFNIGLIEGGSAINIIPRHCAVTWEFRPVPEDDAAAIRVEVERFLAEGLQREFGIGAGRGVDHRLLFDVPALEADPQAAAVRTLQRLLGEQVPISVPFCSEAGFFAAAGIPAVVCGPGGIGQAHQPDEYLEVEQLARCLDLLDGLRRMACSEGFAAPAEA